MYRSVIIDGRSSTSWWSLVDSTLYAISISGRGAFPPVSAAEFCAEANCRNPEHPMNIPSWTSMTTQLFTSTTSVIPFCTIEHTVGTHTHLPPTSRCTKQRFSLPRYGCEPSQSKGDLHGRRKDTLATTLSRPAAALSEIEHALPHFGFQYHRRTRVR